MSTASFNHSYCSKEAAAGTDSAYYITTEKLPSSAGKDTQLWCTEQTQNNYFPHGKGAYKAKGSKRSAWDSSGNKTNYCTQNYWDVAGNKVPCAMGIYQSNRCCNGKYDCTDAGLAKNAGGVADWCTGANMCADPVSYDDAAAWCIQHYNKPVPACNVLYGDVATKTPKPDTAATTPNFMCDALFVGSGGICTAGDNIKTLDACVAYCRNSATNSPACDTLVRAFCERYPGNELCGCVAAQKDVDAAVANGAYVDAHSLVACFDKRCVADVAYKTTDQRVQSQQCPSVCQQVVNLATSGDYSPLNVDNVTFSQHCTDLVQRTELQQQQANAAANVPEPPPLPEVAPLIDPADLAQHEIRKYVYPAAIAAGCYVALFVIGLVVLASLSSPRLKSK